MTFATRLSIAALTAALFAGPALAQAPTEFSQRFDETAPLELTGTIKRLDWGSPVVWIFLKVPDADTAARNRLGYSVTGFSAGAPDVLARTGLNLTSETRAITIRGYRGHEPCEQHPDGVMACKAIARTLTMPNGCTVFIGARGIGAPKDGLDPADGGTAQTCSPG
jgi:hypothetical protein